MKRGGLTLSVSGCNETEKSNRQNKVLRRTISFCAESAPRSVGRTHSLSGDYVLIISLKLTNSIDVGQKWRLLFMG